MGLYRIFPSINGKVFNKVVRPNCYTIFHGFCLVPVSIKQSTSAHSTLLLWNTPIVHRRRTFVNLSKYKKGFRANIRFYATLTNSLKFSLFFVEFSPVL